MKNQDYHCSITVKSTPAEALKSISNISAWWGTDLEGKAEKLHDVFTIHFGETRVTFKVTEMIADKKMIWHVTASHLPWLKDKTEWTNTSVVWEVSQAGNDVKIDMTHAGLTPTVECFENCEKGWNFYIKTSLFKLLTEGKGTPDARKASS